MPFAIHSHSFKVSYLHRMLSSSQDVTKNRRKVPHLSQNTLRHLKYLISTECSHLPKCHHKQNESTSSFDGHSPSIKVSYLYRRLSSSQDVTKNRRKVPHLSQDTLFHLKYLIYTGIYNLPKMDQNNTKNTFDFCNTLSFI